jgi:hypothetical protein
MAPSSSYFVLCVDNEGYPASLEPRKIYRVLGDPVAEERGLRRVIDESGEDYLYPERLFVPIEVPQEGERAFATAG